MKLNNKRFFVVAMMSTLLTAGSARADDSSFKSAEIGNAVVGAASCAASGTVFVAVGLLNFIPIVSSCVRSFHKIGLIKSELARRESISDNTGAKPGVSLPASMDSVLAKGTARSASMAN